MAILKETLHPENNSADDIYPKTSSDQIVDKEFIRNLFLSNDFVSGDRVNADIPNQISKEFELRDGDFVFNYLTNKLYYYYNSQSQEIKLGSDSLKIYVHKIDFGMGTRFAYMISTLSTPIQNYNQFRSLLSNHFSNFGSVERNGEYNAHIFAFYVSYRGICCDIVLPPPASGYTGCNYFSFAGGTLTTFAENSICYDNFKGDTVMEL